MQKIKKRLLALGLCLAVLFGSFTPVQVADAAVKTVKITVGYRGKNVTFQTIRNWNKGPTKANYKKGLETHASLKKAWGKANVVEKNGKLTNYIWKSGKTRICFLETNGRKTYYVIDIQNKKASLCGIKVGMSKKQVLQKLRKQFDKKNVSIENNFIYVNVPRMVPISVEMKSGKVKSINFMCY